MLLPLLLNNLLGSPSSPPTLSAPTPSGTLGTTTTATVGATTDQVSGTLYAVVDTAANLAGVTVSQVKAGQKASGTAALSAGNAAVASASPSVSLSGLTANTAYSYAIAQNNVNGDSNLVSGTFTTAIAGGALIIVAANPPPLAAPTNFVHEQIVGDSTHTYLSWTAVAGADVYNVRLESGGAIIALQVPGTAGAGAYAGKLVYTLGSGVGGEPPLTPSTLYRVYMTALLNDGTRESGPSAVDGATTDAASSGSNPFPDQVQAGVVQVIPMVGGAASGSYGGSGRNTDPANSILFFVDSLDGTTVTAAKYLGYNRVWHGTIRGAASLTGPRIIIFCVEGVIDLGGSDLRLGTDMTLVGCFAPGKGALLTNGQISTAILFGSPAATNQVYGHFSLAPGDGAASVTGAENWDGFQFAGGDNTGANAPDNIFVFNVATHHTSDEMWDGYYLSPTSRISAVSCSFSRALNKSTHTEGGTPGSHPYGPIMGDGKKALAVDFQRCHFNHLAARQAMVAADKFNMANCVFSNPGDVDYNIAQEIRATNDYGAASPNTSALFANVVGCVWLKGVNGYSSTHAISVDPSGSDATTRLPAGSQIYTGHNAVVDWTYASQAALVVGTLPGSYVQSTIRAAAWTFSDATDFSDILKPTATEKNPNAYTTAEIRVVTDPVMNCLGPNPIARTGTIVERDVSEFTAMLNNTAGKGNCINSVSGTENVSGANPWPNTSYRYAPNDGGLPSYGSASSTIASIIAGYFPLSGGEPDYSIVLSGAFANGRPKAGRTVMEIGVLTRHYEVGGQ